MTGKSGEATPTPTPAPTPTAPVPVTVIGGFLGAGKTTLVNHVLASGVAGRAAVIVNDVGEVSIDAALIERHDGDTIALTNGCICCSLSTDFALALPDLLEASPLFDRVIVEASGVSDPGAIAQYGTLPGFRLDGVVVLADAETIRTHAGDPRIGTQVLRQLERADLVLLTKADLVDADTLTTTRSWLEEQLGSVPIVDVSDGRAPLEVVFGANASSDDVVDADRTRHERMPWAGEPGAHGLVTRTVQVSADLTLAQLRAWLDGLPEGILRIKGIVTVADVEAPVLVNAVGRRRRAVPAPWLHDDTEPLRTASGSALVLVGASTAIDAPTTP